MKKAIKPVLLTLLPLFLLGGCAYYSTDFNALIGTSIRDLEKARAEGKQGTFPFSYDTAFDKVTTILKNNGLTVFQTSREKRYIVAMGFPRQTDTTRVGIFFEPLSDNKTKITLSSLSSTALAKAEALIFGELGK
jgi:hypothetical protein